MAFKYKASEIECGGLELKSYIDKKVNNLFNRVYQDMPFITFTRFNDASAITPTANTFTKIPLVATTSTSDDDVLVVNEDGELEFKGNGTRMMYINFNLCATVPTHLTAITRWQVKLERIRKDGTSVLSTYTQRQLPLATTDFSLQFTMPVVYAGGVDEGDKFKLQFSVNQSDVETTWNKMEMVAISKYPIETDYITTSF